MLRSVAVQRIKDALGFRENTNLDDKIVLRLQEAQRDLERGKTLPLFLLQVDQTLTLPVGESTIDLPAGFLRESDDTRIRFTPDGTDTPVFLEREQYIPAVLRNIRDDDQPTFPRVYVIRRGATDAFIDFITTASETFTLTWDYYKADALLTSDIENEWLENAPEWLLGEAGLRIAADIRNPDAVQLFMAMIQKARAATFGEIIAAEEASGPYILGANS